MISANFYWQKKRKFEESTRSVNLRCFPSRWILQILINQRRFDERLERKETRKIEAILRSCQRPNINLVVDAFNSSTCVNCLLARGSTEARITPEITVADRSDRFKTELTTCSYVGLAEIMKCTDDEMGERTPVCACVRAACNAARLRLYNARPGKVRPLNRRLSNRHAFLDTSSTWSSVCLFFLLPSWPPFCTPSVRKQRSNYQIDSRNTRL